MVTGIEDKKMYCIGPAFFNFVSIALKFCGEEIIMYWYYVLYWST